MTTLLYTQIRRLAAIALTVGGALAFAGTQAQNINATVAPNENGSDNYIDIQNTSGSDWYFYTAPTPSGASMSRMDDDQISEFPWGDVGNFQADPANHEDDRIYSGEYLRVYAGTVAAGTVIQVAYATTPVGTQYDFNVTVTSGAQVTAINITDASPTSAATVHWAVTFDQPISGVTAANFAFDNPNGITDLNISAVTPTGAQPTANWTVTATDGSGTGLLGLNWVGHVSESPPVPNEFVGQDYTFSIFPVIGQDLANVGINIGSTTTMTIVASIRGTATLNYQWYSGTSVNPSAATAISGATGSSYTPPTFTSLGTFQYFCRVYTTAPDYTDSSTANVTVVDPPSITTQPQGAIEPSGGAVTLSVSASGTSLTYQWYQGTAPNTSDPVGNGTASLALSDLTATASYWVQIKNAGPTVASSSTATVTVVSSITAQAASYTSPVNDAYSQPFAVIVKDSANNVVPNLPITFIAPSSGASGTFPGSQTLVTLNTDSGGVATAPTFTANGVAGGFSIVVKYTPVETVLDASNSVLWTSASSATFLTGLSNSFVLTESGVSNAGYKVTGTLPSGVTLSAAGVLGGKVPVGAGGSYPLTITLTNAAGFQSPEAFNLTVLEENILAAHPSFFTNGAGWALNGDIVNGGPSIVNNVFTPTDGSTGENRSAWFRYPLYVGAFQASFFYYNNSGNGADGAAFVMQNSAAGTTALGNNGGALGYCGITNSAALLFNIYSASPGGPSGLMVGTNGVGAYNTVGVASGRSYGSTAPVNLELNDPIEVNLVYSGGVLQVSLLDLANGAPFQTNMAVNLTNLVGGNTAWVGFTGSEGSVTSHQTISGFTFAPHPTLTTQPTAPTSQLLEWPASVVGFLVQAKTNLTDSVWTTLSTPPTASNGTNQLLVPDSNGADFYRLVLP